MSGAGGSRTRVRPGRSGAPSISFSGAVRPSTRAPSVPGPSQRALTRRAYVREVPYANEGAKDGRGRKIRAAIVFTLATTLVIALAFARLGQRGRPRPAEALLSYRAVETWAAPMKPDSV